MCLIIKKPAKRNIPDTNMYTSYAHNADGWGIMYATKGRVHVTKNLGHINKAIKQLDTLRGHTAYVHMRYKTHGAIDLDNTHPYCILDHDRDGLDLYMMHNGILQTPDLMRDRSDTWHYAMMLRGILASNPTLLDDKAFMRTLARDCTGSKLVFLRGDGKDYIVNRDAGKVIDGLWYSNTYSLIPVRYTEEDDLWDYKSYWKNKGYKDEEPDACFIHNNGVKPANTVIGKPYAVVTPAKPTLVSASNGKPLAGTVASTLPQVINKAAPSLPAIEKGINAEKQKPGTRLSVLLDAYYSNDDLFDTLSGASDAALREYVRWEPELALAMLAYARDMLT